MLRFSFWSERLQILFWIRRLFNMAHANHERNLPGSLALAGLKRGAALENDVIVDFNPRS